MSVLWLIGGALTIAVIVWFCAAIDDWFERRAARREQIRERVARIRVRRQSR